MEKHIEEAKTALLKKADLDGSGKVDVRDAVRALDIVKSKIEVEGSKHPWAAIIVTAVVSVGITGMVSASLSKRLADCAAPAAAKR